MKPEAVKALQELEHENGDLVAGEVCEAARPEGSPLHRYFTWDDRAAANSHRLQQARLLIDRYKVEIVVRGPASEGELRVLTRGYAAASRTGTKAPPGTYRPINRLTPLEKNVLLQTMHREIEALRRRYGHLAEFWEAIAGLSGEAPDGEKAAASG